MRRTGPSPPKKGAGASPAARSPPSALSPPPDDFAARPVRTLSARRVHGYSDRTITFADSAMPTLHLVCAGAGKTTHALRLSGELGALRLSIDDWMVTLFGPDAPDPPQWPWIAERLARAERLVLATAADGRRRGLPVVLDLSFLQADQRRRAAEAARAAGLGVRLHLLDPDPEERRRRVRARNEARGETCRVAVSRPMFDFSESLWRRPTPEEMAALDGVRVA